MNNIITYSPLIKSCELRNNPVIVNVVDFDEDASKKFQEDVSCAHNTGQNVIPIVINSYGGSVHSLLSMVDVLKNAELQIATIAMGKAMSAGAILFTCGNPGMRFMSQNSTLMFHSVSSWMHGKLEEMKVKTEEIERLNKIIFKIASKNCGHEDSYFYDIYTKSGYVDWYLDAQAALNHNIANRICIPSLRTKVDVEVTFG